MKIIPSGPTDDSDLLYPRSCPSSLGENEKRSCVDSCMHVRPSVVMVFFPAAGSGHVKVQLYFGKGGLMYIGLRCKHGVAYLLVCAFAGHAVLRNTIATPACWDTC